jgi:arsenite-transporting ATPase
MRLILFTGKGGVGKTTLATATALACAKKGRKTLVVSTDAAHSLSDSFDIPLANAPTAIAPNLWGREISALEEIQKKWGDIQDYLTAFLASQGLNSIEAEELSVFPGMEELFSLMEIRTYQKTAEFDVVVVDCAPTGETLRLLSAPEVTGWYLKHIFPIQRTAAKAVRPLADRLLPFPFPEDRVFEALKKLTLQLAEMKEILEDGRSTSIRLVVNPEKMVIKEAQRAYTFFNLFDFQVDAVIVNRTLPAEVEDPYFVQWKAIQESYLRLIDECFSPLPIFSLPLYDREIVGLKLLDRIGSEVYAGRDPASLFFTRKPMKIGKENGRHVLTVHLPFVGKETLDLTQKGEDLIIKAGAFKRTILLPRVLLQQTVEKAVFENDQLRIFFASPELEKGDLP